MEKVAIPPARVMRIIWFGFLLSGVMLIYIVVAVPYQAPWPVGPTLEVVLTIPALLGVLLGFRIPRILGRAAKRSRNGRAGSSELTGWFGDNFIGLAWIYSCNVYAFVLHFFRARAGFVELLFGVGMISLLLWQPGTPPVVKAGKIAKQ